MKKNYFILAAIASVALASCSNDEYFGDPGGLTGEKAISFDMSTPSVTRAEYGETAANTLNRNFVVFGYKTMSDNTTQTVFDNYQVNYTENTADKTESNSANWEYVGYKNLNNGVTENTGVKAFTATANYGGTEQSIKYWDWSATSYDFFAYSLGKGKTVETTTTYATVNKMTATGYTLTGDNAQLAACYVSDKIHRSDKSNTGNFNKNNTQIQFSFRAFNSKVRLGVYEIIPGYSVKNVHFYTSSTTTTTQDVVNTENAPTLYASGEVLPSGGSYNITFNAETGAAEVAFTETGATKTNKIQFGELSGFVNKEYNETAGEVYLGRTANNATKTAYQTILPNPTGTNLTLKVDYTLVSRDGSGENIEVKGATAQVPQLYAKWKPGYAYTYLFKITDDGNGEIGGVAGLYPITFDAMVEEVEDATGKVQETISTVATPSITTYQNGTKDKNEYLISSDIFIVVDNNGTLLDLDQNDHPTYLYKVSSTPARDPETYTEAEVVKALQVVQTTTGDIITGRNGIILTPVTKETNATNYGDDKWLIWNKIDPMVDGTQIQVDATKNQVVKFKTTTAGFYAFVYTDTKSDATVDKYEAVAELTAGTSVAPYYWYYKYVTEEDAIEGETYYTRSGENPNFTYTVGVPDPAFYYGQTFAAGTDYYYGTNDGEKTKWTGIIKTPETGYNYFTKTGDTYTAVAAGTIIAYANFNPSGLYKKEGETPTAVPAEETVPVVGTEYYNDITCTTRVYILPQQTTGYYRLVESTVPEKCPAGEQAVVGKRYYDKYTQNQTTYAVKVIKVQ